MSVARCTVTDYFAKKISKPLQLTTEHFGVFVTIHKNKALRGCIGLVIADQGLENSVPKMAIAAATQDPRFEPMILDEIDSVLFEVTVLSIPQRLKGERIEYPEIIVIGRDGLIIKDELHNGLLLPQVPLEFGWNSREFLDQTCIKAGLENNCWMNKETIVQSFSGTIFTELEPNGKIVRT